MVRTFYDVLDVSPSATDEEVETAYRDRLKDTHPDLNDEDAAADAVKAVIEAGDVLTDEDERERYDRLGHETYVAVTDAYDPADVRTEPTATTVDPATGTQSTRERRGQNTEAGSEAATGTSATTQRRSTSAGDVNAANANPGGVNWATGDVDAHPAGTASESRPTASTNERSILFLASLIAYPILVFSSIFPPFPLVFRVIIAACTVALVVYLVSVPRVSAPAFGIWTLIAGGFIYATGAPIPSPVSIGALTVTAGPFVLSLFVRSLRL